jgi:hypothetical protein
MPDALIRSTNDPYRAFASGKFQKTRNFSSPVSLHLGPAQDIVQTFFGDTRPIAEKMMSEAGSENIAHPADRCESIRTLLRAGHNDEAIVRMCAPPGRRQRYGHDQYMLGSQLCPIIRDKCLVHDKY